MTPEQSLLQLLQREEQSLRRRDFSEIASFMAEKEALALKVSGDADKAILAQLRDQISVNERLLGITAKAAASLSGRLEKAARAVAGVGYSPDGSQLSCDRTQPTRRV